LGRKILVPTAVDAALRACHTLVAMTVAALLVLALALSAPVAAQEETTSRTTNGTQTVTKDNVTSDKQEELVQGGEQQTKDSAEEADAQADKRAADTLQGADALIIKDPSDGAVDRIEIDAADCVVEEKSAIVTVNDEEGNPETFTNAPDDGVRDADDVEATIVPEADQVIIDVADDANPNPAFSPDDADEEGRVASSTGVACGRNDDGNNTASGDENQAGNTKNNEDLEDLSCEELLVLFRGGSSSGQQYEDAAVFADSGVRAQVEVCLEREIVEGTAADEDLPDTGGLSLLAVAVLGVVSAAAGLSVIRGGRR
jgi:hypothetical protein